MTWLWSCYGDVWPDWVLYDHVLHDLNQSPSCLSAELRCHCHFCPGHASNESHTRYYSWHWLTDGYPCFYRCHCRLANLYRVSIRMRDRPILYTQRNSYWTICLCNRNDQPGPHHIWSGYIWWQHFSIGSSLFQRWLDAHPTILHSWNLK